MKKLYMNPCGRDQWITLDQPNKKIELLDIQSGQLEIIQFLTKKAAKDNYEEWLDKQVVRLPKTFIIKTSNRIIRSKLFNLLTKLNLKTPPGTALKDYIIYHYSQNKYVCMVIENFENSLLPVIDSKYLLKVHGYKERESMDNSMYTLNTGLFRGDVRA
ncbi:MAG: hypothetical protein JEZ05_06285 [Tenericutes bacterium]|nr:hypothetical protein [Mycoplasmatota bacterium]